jgi:D-beta-D-heptose 7-phosphate kinase/D-beta-D-heptose 1-phosphate adenosyltransferase
MPSRDPAAAIDRLSKARVLVVGDAMLDRYIFGRVERLSPEAPVPVLTTATEHDEPGGAGNVVHNLCALGAATAFVSVVGDDAAGAELTGLIGGQPGVEPWLLVQGSRITTVKTRYIAQGTRQGGQQLLRTDREDTRPIHPRLSERLVRIARDAMAATSVLILSDYRKGVLAGDIPAQLIAAAHAAWWWTCAPPTSPATPAPTWSSRTARISTPAKTRPTATTPSPQPPKPCARPTTSAPSS